MQTPSYSAMRDSPSASPSSRISTTPPLVAPNPLVPTSPDAHLLTTGQATVSLVKGIAGAGIFAIPWALLQSGLLAGVLGIACLALLSSTSIKLLASIKRAMFGSASVTYLHVGERVLGEDAGRLIAASICACSFGVCTVYLTFIRCMGSSLFPQLSAAWPSAVFLLPALPVIVGLCLLRSYRMLALTALIGDFSIFLGALCVVLSGVSSLSAAPLSASLLWPHPSSDLLLKPHTFPLFLSTAAFLFCVHFFILPIEANMQNPSRDFPRAVDRSFLVTAVFNALFGVVGLVCFANPNAIVLDNVRGGAWVTAVKVLLCLDMVFSYAVVFFPGREIIENALLGTDSPPSSPPLDRYSAVASEDDPDHAMPPAVAVSGVRSLLSPQYVAAAIEDIAPSSPSWASPMAALSLEGRRNVIRVSLVMFTVLVALCVPLFSVVVGLVGGLSMTALGFVFPPLMALRLRKVERQARMGGEHAVLVPSAGWRGDGARKDGWLADWLELSYYAGLIGFGVLIMLLTVVTSGFNIVHALQSDAPMHSC